MTLSDWNKSIAFAKATANELIRKGIPCTQTTYSTYKGEKGIYLNALDADSRLYKQYASGIHSTFNGMKKQLVENKRRILALHGKA